MKSVVKHVYNRTRNGGLLFYSVIDCLVYFTLFCSLSRKYDIIVLGLCLMFDHIHILSEIQTHSQITCLMRESSSRYARAFNMSSGMEGQIFDKSFGCAIKVGGKKVRTNIAYLYNNPVEKKLCKKAEEYRWNFLAYRNSTHPFSPAIYMEKARKPLRDALAEVKSARSDDKPLTYNQLYRLIDKLDKTEREQLTDYIISTYNCIDYDAASAYYNSFDDMLIAIHSNTGSEYDIQEISTRGDDRVYKMMTRTLMKEYKMSNVKRLLSKPIDEKQKIAELLYGYTQASREQIGKYLWMSRDRITKRRKKASGAQVPGE